MPAESRSTGPALASLGERQLVITRTIDAPRELVFQAWTEPHHLVHWWGPRGFRTPVCEMDVRPGGGFRITMRSPEGEEYRIKGVYHEIVAPSAPDLETFKRMGVVEGWGESLDRLQGHLAKA